MTFVNRRKSLYTGKTSKPASDAAQVGLRRELDGPGKLLAAMWLPRPAPRLPLGALAPNPWNQPLREALCSSRMSRPQTACSDVSDFPAPLATATPMTRMRLAHQRLPLFTGMTPPMPQRSPCRQWKTSMTALPPASPRLEADGAGSRHSHQLDAECQHSGSRTPTACRGGSACLTRPERASELLAPMRPRCDRHRPRSPRSPCDFPFGNCCHFSGTNPFAKVLAGLAPLPFFPACFTFKTTPDFPFGN